MSNRSLGAARVVQKKLHKIIKDLSQREELRLVLTDESNSIPNELQVFVNSDQVDRYEEDAITFKKDVETGFKYLSKMRGKKKDFIETAEYFRSLLEINFPGVFENEEEVVVAETSSRKRGRHSLDGNVVEEVNVKNASTSARSSSRITETTSQALSTKLSNAEKNELKSIILKLIKNPVSEPFLHPVDRRVYPEYYEAIKRPMDLETARNKLNEYSSVPEALDDLRLIWENCRQFNEEGSDITSWTYVMGDALEALVEERFGAEFVQRKKHKKSRVTAKTEAVTEEEPAGATAGSAAGTVGRKRKNSEASIVLPRAVLSSIVSTMAANPFSAPFLSPVDLRSAPGYLEVVSEPMDLDTVRKNVKLGLYDSDASLFARHIRLICDNCVTYNDRTSEIAIWAQKFAAAFDAEFQQASHAHFGGKKDTRAVDEDKEAPSAGRKPRKSAAENANDSSSVAVAGAPEDEPHKGAAKPLSATVRKMKKLLKEVNNHELAAPFHFPINLSLAPGYLSVIKTPMDLSTVRSRIPEYDENPERLLSDLRLIFNNCQAYNQEDSQLFRAAGMLRDFAETLFAEYFPSVAVLEESKDAAKTPRKSKAEVSSSQQAPASKPLTEALTVTRPVKSAAKPVSLEQVGEILKQLQDSEQDIPFSPLVRDTAARQAAEVLKATKLPFQLVPSLYEVQSFGEIRPELPGSFAESFIHPIRYACGRTLRLCIIPTGDSQDGGVHSAVPFVSVEVKSVVSIADDRCSYSVALLNGTVVSRGDTPRLAWEGVFGKEFATLRVLGSKMDRCRAVLNRLCISPDSVPFLEQVPLDGADGASYYAAVSAPMWLREVHSRLVSGAYDNEFDFAWDVRLVFTNCVEYNAAGSRLVQSAHNTSRIFEQLLVHWVHNVQDRAVDDLAQGLWSDWAHLRYFDSLDPEENVCVLTGERGRESDMVQCQWCEDQYLRTAVKVAASNKNRWSCTRCNRALELSSNDLCGDPFSQLASQKLDVPYSCEEFGGNVFVCAPDLGPGWCQARRRKAGGTVLKNLFLSPLGYEVFSREDVAAQEEYEAVVNTELHKAREKEFQDQLQASKAVLKTGKSAGKQKRSVRHQRKTARGREEVSEESAQTAAQQPATSVLTDLEEEGRIPAGKLARFEVPAGYRAAWFVCGDEDLALQTARQGGDLAVLVNNRVELDTSRLLEDGFFGLSLPEVRHRIEGLDLASACGPYVFMHTHSVYEALKSNVVAEQEKQAALTEGENRLRRTLLEERWFWETCRLNPWPLCPMPDQRSSSSSAENFSTGDAAVVTKVAGLNALFPSHFTAVQGDTLLAVWDFLDAAKTWVGAPALSLQDLVRSLERPASPLATYGQVVFDEVCCMLTEMLFAETRLRGDLGAENDKEWQSVLMTRPMNILSWPQIALDMFRTLACPLSNAEIKVVMSRALSTDLTEQNYLMCLLFLHPALDLFLSSSGPQAGWMDETTRSVAKTTLHSVLEIRDRFCRMVSAEIAVSSDESVGVASFNVTSFCENVRDIFLAVYQTPEVDVLYKTAARDLLQWFGQTANKFGVDVSLTGLDSDVPSTDMAHSETRKSMQFRRFWGGLLLSNTDTPREQVVTPFSFVNYVGHNDYELRLVALTSLERVIEVLRRSEPESLSLDDRLHVYSVLVDQCANCKVFSGSARARHGRIKHMLGEYSEQQVYLPVEVTAAMEPVRVNSRSGAVCHFTGIPMKSSFENAKWVAVPAQLLVPPLVCTDNSIVGENTPAPASETVENNSAQGYRFRGTRHVDTGDSVPQRVALQTAVLRVAGAREVAKQEKTRYDDHINRQLSSLSLPPSPFRSNGEVETERPLFHRAMPAGFDRSGSSYWVLSAQESMTLFPYGANGACAVATTSGMLPLEPCVLVRGLAGFWSFHHGHEVEKLFASFSAEIACERLLFASLVERLVYTRRLLFAGTLRIKSAQQEWIDRRIRAERWINQVRLSDELSLMQTLRLIEVVWARCVEARMYLHYAGIYKREEDPVRSSVRAEKDAIARRQKRIRESLQDDAFDHHPIKGWYRLDVLLRLRELASTSTATRIHADSTVFGTVSHNLKQSAYHQPMFVAPAQLPTDSTALMPAEPTETQKDSTAQLQKENETVEVNQEAKSVGAVEAAVAGDSLLGDMEDFLNLAEALSGGDEVPAVPGTSKPSATESAAVPMETDDAPSSLEVQQQAYLKMEASGAADTYDPELEQALELSFSTQSRTRPVEQLHLVTGEVLRVYPRATDAAMFMNVSQSGISLCCTGVKPDCYGFRWRNYEGPPIDFDAIKERQMPIEELKKLQLMRGKPIDYNPEEEQARVRSLMLKRSSVAKPSAAQVVTLPLKGAPLEDDAEGGNERSTRKAARNASESIAVHLAPKQQQLGPMSGGGLVPAMSSYVNASAQQVLPNKYQPLLPISNVLVSGRMLKLKAELLSMYYIVPEKQLRWPEPDEEGLKSIEQAGLAAASSVLSAGKATHSAQAEDNDNDEDGQQVTAAKDEERMNLERLADKASRKAKRRLKRKLAIEKFMNNILNAASPQQLMNEVVTFERAIPANLLFTYNQKLVPPDTNCLATVAQRIYVLDRALRYDEMKGAELQSAACTYKLRTQFVPRCLLSASCTRFMCHGGKCSNFTENASRVPDLVDQSTAPLTVRPMTQFPAQDRVSRYPGMGAGGFMGHEAGAANHGGITMAFNNAMGGFRRPMDGSMGGGAMQQRYRDEYEIREAARRPEKAVVDIEAVQPYVPGPNEILGFEWV